LGFFSLFFFSLDFFQVEFVVIVLQNTLILNFFFKKMKSCLKGDLPIILRLVVIMFIF